VTANGFNYLTTISKSSNIRVRTVNHKPIGEPI